MPKQKTIKTKPSLWRIMFGVLLLALAAYALASHWHTVSVGLSVARGARPLWFGIALILMAATFLIASSIYGVLALHRLRYAQTVLIELSSAFVNRLLPSGIGGLGLHGAYLYKRKHTAAEATVVVSVNNLLGMVAHLLLLAGVIVVQPRVLHALFRNDDLSVSGQLFAGILLVVLLLLLVPAVRTKLIHFGLNLLSSVRKLRWGALVRALVLALLLTTTYTFILFASAASVGLHLGVLQIFIVFSIGMLVGTATPTPGGLVGAEAGLFAGFVAYGVSAPDAAAVVLLYRFVTYWLPLIPGLFALLYARRRHLL